MQIHGQIIRHPSVLQRQTAMPPLADYEAWLAEHRASKICGGHRRNISAQKYRLIATLARTTSNKSEIARKTGLSSSGVIDALARLPENLR